MDWNTYFHSSLQNHISQTIYLLYSLPLTSRWSCDPAGWPQWSESVAGRRPPATDSCLCTEHTRLHRRHHHLLNQTAKHTGNGKETNTVTAALYVTRNGYVFGLLVTWMLSRPRCGPSPLRLYDDALSWASLTFSDSRPSGGHSEIVKRDLFTIFNLIITWH